MRRYLAPSLSTRILTGEEAPRKNALCLLGYGARSASKDTATLAGPVLHSSTPLEVGEKSSWQPERRTW